MLGAALAVGALAPRATAAESDTPTAGGASTGVIDGMVVVPSGETPPAADPSAADPPAADPPAAAEADSPSSETAAPASDTLTVIARRYRDEAGKWTERYEAMEFKIHAAAKVLVGGQEIEIDGIKEGTEVRVRFVCIGDPPPSLESGDCQAVNVQVVDVRGIWRHNMTFGFQLSEERGSFSEQDAILMFSSDTLLNQKKKSRFHSYFDLGLVSVPSQQAAAANGNGEMTEEEALDSFLSSEKSLRLELGLYWVRELYRGEDVLNMGWVGRYGFQSLTDLGETAGAADPAAPPPPGTEDTALSYFATGFRFAHHKRVPRQVNPEILRSVEILAGYYENFFSEDELRELGVENAKDQRQRLVIHGEIRLPGTIPVFAGVNANLGRGKDDLRIYLAARLDIEKLAGLLPAP